MRVGPFGDAAVELKEAQLYPIPVEGKSSLVRGFTQFSGTPSPQMLGALIQRYADKNVAILTGLRNGVSVLDFDGPDAIQLAEDCGSPLVVATPSGGAHAYCRFQGEPSRNLRPVGFDGDLKASKSYVLVPPSKRADGRKYEFVKGCWEDLCRLPPIPEWIRSKLSLGEQDKRVSKGQRNDWIFEGLRRKASKCAEFDDLLAIAALLNGECSPSLPELEVVKIAQSVWKYKQEGRIWGTKHRVGYCDLDDQRALMGFPVAFQLLMYLRTQHANKHEFAICPKGLAPVMKSSPNTVRKARDKLVELELVELLRKGGRKVGDPNLYRLGVQILNPIELDTPPPQHEGKDRANVNIGHPRIALGSPECE
jgi:hypothetical protein